MKIIEDIKVGYPKAIEFNLASIIAIPFIEEKVFLQLQTLLEIEIDTVGNNLTIDTISEAISDLLDVTLLGSDINYCNGIFGTFNIIENSQGLETMDGDYIAFYWFKISPKPEYINLEQLFGGSN